MARTRNGSRCDARSGEERIPFATLDRLGRADPGHDDAFTGNHAAIDGQQIARRDRNLFARL